MSEFPENSIEDSFKNVILRPKGKMMGSITDYAAIVIILIAFWHGWNKGLLEMVLGPLSIILAAGSGLWFYNTSHNLLYSIGVAIALPFLLRIIIVVFQKILAPSPKDKDAKMSDPLPTSSLLAAFLNMVWWAFLFVSILFGFLIVPVENEFVEKARTDIKQSETFQLLQDLSDHQLPEKPLSEKKIKEWTRPIDFQKWGRVERLDENK